ncbi:MAG: DUF2093 domain-containing protein [Pseudomonadota bacterium]
MLERINPSNAQVATVKYLDADFHVLVPGTHVVCAISGKNIPLDDLKYWSWERQEAYVDAHASLEAELASR